MGLNILMISSEAEPFAKSGGLGDVVSALSVNLKKLGHDVRILLPAYGDVADKDPTFTLWINLGVFTEEIEITETALPSGDVPVYLLHHESISNEIHPYTEDDLYKFALLSKTAFTIKSTLGWPIQVLHAHDWPAGLVPVYRNSTDYLLSNYATVFSIHNLGYQGVFSRHEIHRIGLSAKEYKYLGIADGHKINLMQGAILNSDQLVTVSPSYATEIQEEQNGYGLHLFLRERSGNLEGILNGVNYEDWDPACDKHLPYPYDSLNPTGKAKNKKYIQNYFSLEPVNVPLICMVSRIVDQKGFDLLCADDCLLIRQLCEKVQAQMIILGTGDPGYETQLNNLNYKIPNFRALTTYNNAIAHRIEAAADFFLMPSRYEPCGLNQLYSLRYGTIPVVRSTGGLKDTVEPVDLETGEGTGFVFDAYRRRAVLETVTNAVDQWYHNPTLIRRLRKRGMRRDFSWKASAKKYEQIYYKTLYMRNVQLSKLKT